MRLGGLFRHPPKLGFLAMTLSFLLLLYRTNIYSISRAKCSVNILCRTRGAGIYEWRFEICIAAIAWCKVPFFRIFKKRLLVIKHVTMQVCKKLESILLGFYIAIAELIIEVCQVKFVDVIKRYFVLQTTVNYTIGELGCEWCLINIGIVNRY